MISTDQLRERIEAAWEGEAALTDPAIAAAVEEAIDLLDSGAIRVASKESPYCLCTTGSPSPGVAGRSRRPWA